jgi:hypothetical protein
MAEEEKTMPQRLRGVMTPNFVLSSGPASVYEETRAYGTGL